MFEDIVFEANIETLIAMGELYQKQFIMEEAAPPTPAPPDPSDSGTDTETKPPKALLLPAASGKKWSQFVNWVKRAINTILAKIQNKKFQEKLDNIKDRDFSSSMSIELDSQIITMMERDKDPFNLSGLNRQIYSFPGPIHFDRNYGAQYEKCANWLSTCYEKYTGTSGIKRKVKGSKIQTFIEKIRTIGKKMAEMLTTMNDELKEIGTNLSKEDKGSQAFQQFTRMITLIMQVDLQYVKAMSRFIDAASTGQVSDVDPDVPPEPVKLPDVTSDDGFPPDAKHVVKDKWFDKGLSAWIFDRNPRCKAVYIFIEDDNDTIHFYFDTNGDGSGITEKVYKLSEKRNDPNLIIKMVFKMIPFDKYVDKAREGIIVKRP